MFQKTSERTNNSTNNSNSTQINRRGKVSKSKVSPEEIHVIEMPHDTTDNKRKSGIAQETIDRISALVYALLFITFDIYYCSFFLSEADKK
jgi:hypothetical protein